MPRIGKAMRAREAAEWQGYGGARGRAELLRRYQASLEYKKYSLRLVERELTEAVVEALVAVDAADRGEGKGRLARLLRHHQPLPPMVQAIVAEWVERRDPRAMPAYLQSDAVRPETASWYRAEAKFRKWLGDFKDE